MKSESLPWKVNICDYWKPKVDYKFDLVWSNSLGTPQHTVHSGNGTKGKLLLWFKGSECKTNEEISGNVIKSIKCNQCHYASSHTGNMRTHLKMHTGEKSNKYNQCDYASSQAGNLRRHLKTHSGEKSNKCNQCDYTCSDQSALRPHLKTHSGEK